MSDVLEPNPGARAAQPANPGLNSTFITIFRTYGVHEDLRIAFVEAE